MQSHHRNLVAIGAVTICIVLVLCACDQRDERYGSTKIVDGRDVPAANKYCEEFAAALKISTHWNTGEPLKEPFVYLPFVNGPLLSPDGEFCLTQTDNLDDGYHTLTLSRTNSQSVDTVLIIQEADVGSGTSHAYQWSHDSKAVFIHGSGRPAGQPLLRDFAFVYLVDQRELYSVNLAPWLTNRIKLENK